jgi:hypothetical protein
MGDRADRRERRSAGDARETVGDVSSLPAGTPGLEREMSLEIAARDYVWLYDLRHGISPRAIAARSGVPIRQVREGIERARALENRCSKDNVTDSLKPGRQDDLGFRLIPLFPIAAFTPRSECPHHDTLERGSKLCCMVCHGSGMDDHPGLRRDTQTDPSPEPQPAPAPAAAPRKSGGRKETRKQRRGRQFAEAAVA